MLAHGSYGTVLAYLAHSGLAPQRFAATITHLAQLRAQYPGRDLVLVMLSVPESNTALEALGMDRDTAGVVAAVFEPLQALDEDGDDVAVRDRGDDAAHGVDLQNDQAL